MDRLHLTKVAIGSFAVALMAPPVAAATDVEPAELSACVTSTQRLVKVAFGDAPESPCSDIETEVRWTVERAAPEPIVVADLVEGATLSAREVEPGVLRILEDGTRNLRRNEDVVAGRDGSVWVFRNDRFFELGDPKTHRWSNDLFDDGQDSSEDIEVGPDGTIWWADADGEGLKSFDGTEWRVRRPAPKGGGARVDQVEVLDDGTVYASWWLGGPGPERRQVARLDGERWTIVDGVPGSGDARLGVSEDEDATLFLREASGSQRIYRGSLSDGDGPGLVRIGRPGGRVVYVDSGSDGTVWMHLERNLRTCGPDRCPVRERQILAQFDGTDWTEYPLADGLGDIGGLMTAPDGSVWSATCDFAGETGDVHGCELLRFDGETWSRFLGKEGYGDIDEIAFAADGNVWSISGPNDLFVVRPEAVRGSR